MKKPTKGKHDSYNLLEVCEFLGRPSGSGRNGNSLGHKLFSRVSDMSGFRYDSFIDYRIDVYDELDKEIGQKMGWEPEEEILFRVFW
jgi:hypothetical protein